jgi:selenocysteine lyase/cysteine desulfurase
MAGGRHNGRAVDGDKAVDLHTEFPILARKTYLNSCSLGALSQRALSYVHRFHEEWHAYGASAWYEIWVSRMEQLRAAVARMIHASPEEVALTASVSTALASLASSIDYTRRNRVVVSELDFPTLAYQWMVRPGVEVIHVKSDDGATIDAQRFADAVTDRTAIVATSHVFFTTGAIQDLAALARIAHARGALFIVDAYQSAGQVPIDVKAAGADALITGPLKWLLGGPGLAYLYVRRELAAQLRPTTAGWFGAKDQFSFDIRHFEFKPDARRFEMGTPALPTIHAALGGQELIDETGIGRIRERNAMLTARLIERAIAAGYRVRCAPKPESRSAIVMVAHGDPGAAVARLADRNIIVDWRPGYVRISPHFYNTEAEVDLAIDALVAGDRS